jgi:hypothetical protein
MELNTNMPIILVPVKKGQTLSEVEQIYPLPTNGIFHKRLPGLGATYGEINAPRHSIIVLPNRPVIESKEARHNNENDASKKILGVYQGVSKDDIIEYLSDERVIYKKILITPESYDKKFREAVQDIWGYILKEYYFLVDECERAIQDIDFRDRITAPFEDFFDFTNKGLVSATTLPFSDPRFEEEEFTHYVIEPAWDYCQPLKLITTNSVVAATRDYFTSKQADCYFIFLSSIKTMTALIDVLGIKSESKIHCSEKRIKELKLRSYKADSQLDLGKLAKYNFLTSRYYSAIDIELDFKPEVLMITEVLFAEHSILDPQTEVIQIAGRFRKGTTSVTHISNVNPKIAIRDATDARTFMDGQQHAFKQILQLKGNIKSEGGQDFIDRILTEPQFCKYFMPDGSYNWFMLDNFIQEQRVLGIYKDFPTLEAAYLEVNRHFKVEVEQRIYILSDEDRLKRETVESRRALLKAVTEQLERLEPKPDTYYLGNRDAELKELKEIAPVIVTAFPIIGAKGIEEVNYNERRVKAKAEKALIDQKLNSPELSTDINRKFKIGDKPIEMYIVTTLQDLYDRHSIKLKAYATHIQKFFDAERTTQGTGDNKVYHIRGPLKSNDSPPID